MSKIYSLILDYMQSHRLPRLEFYRAEAMVVQKGWKTGTSPTHPPTHPPIAYSSSFEPPRSPLSSQTTHSPTH